MRSRYLIGAVAGTAGVVGVVAALLVMSDDPDGAGVPGVGADGQADVRLVGRSFTISGDADRPLSPGRSAPIDLEVENPFGDPLRVDELRVRVRAVRAPRADERHPCTRRDFRVRQLRTGFAVIVPAGATRSLDRLGVARSAWPRVRMVNRPVNQDGCKGASITLAYDGSGSLRR